MHGLRIMLAVGVFGWLASSGFAQAPDLSRMDIVMRSVPDGPVARVGERSIPKDEYLAYYETELAEQAARQGSARLDDITRIRSGVRALMQVVQREILYQAAVEAKISISNDEMSKRWTGEIESIKKRVPHAKDKQLTEADILKAAGTTRESAMEELRKGLMIEKFSDQLAQKKNVTVTDAEVSKYFEDNKERFKRPGGIHFLQVFVNTRDQKGPFDEKRKADARQRIDTALKRIRAGESFEAVAKTASEAPDKDKGGDMGWVPAPGLPPMLVEAAAKMKPGEVSEVIESPIGFHVVRLVESSPAADVPFDKAGPEIRRMLLVQKTSLAVAAFCEPYMSKPGYIQPYLDLQKTIAANPELAAKMQKEADAAATAGAKAGAKADKPDKAPKKKTEAPKADAAPKKKKNAQ